MTKTLLTIVFCTVSTAAVPADAKRGHPPSRARHEARFGETKAPVRTAAGAAKWGQISIFAASLPAAQHEGHGGAAQPAQPNAACVQGGQQALGTVEAAAQRLEAARQTNSAAEMRAAVADLQAALGMIRTQLASCRAPSTRPPSGHDHHSAATPEIPVAQPGSPAAAPGAASTPAEAVDPVCAMKVNPTTAPSADYRGRTYYFCSEADRQTFMKDPGKYVTKE